MFPKEPITTTYLRSTVIAEVEIGKVIEGLLPTCIFKVVYTLISDSASHYDHLLYKFLRYN